LTAKQKKCSKSQFVAYAPPNATFLIPHGCLNLGVLHTPLTLTPAVCAYVVRRPWPTSLPKGSGGPARLTRFKSGLSIHQLVQQLLHRPLLYTFSARSRCQEVYKRCLRQKSLLSGSRELPAAGPTHPGEATGATVSQGWC